MTLPAAVIIGVLIGLYVVTKLAKASGIIDAIFKDMGYKDENSK